MLSLIWYWEDLVYHLAQVSVHIFVKLWCCYFTPGRQLYAAEIKYMDIYEHE